MNVEREFSVTSNSMISFHCNSFPFIFLGLGNLGVVESSHTLFLIVDEVSASRVANARIEQLNRPILTSYIDVLWDISSTRGLGKECLTTVNPTESLRRNADKTRRGEGSTP